MTTFFIAGATGYTGREVVRLARERGVHVVAHIRPDSSSRARWTEAFEGMGATVDTTAWEPEAMAEALAACQPSHVFALLGTTKARARREAAEGAVEPSYETVDFGLTAMLLDAARGCEPQPRFVYLSSMGVTEARPSNAYLDVRWRIEKQLREGALPFTVVRPSFITGPDRDEPRLFERVGATVADGALAVAGWLGGRRLQAKYASISNTDLAAALVRLALDPAADGAVVEADGLR